MNKGRIRGTKVGVGVGIGVGVRVRVGVSVGAKVDRGSNGGMGSVNG